MWAWLAGRGTEAKRPGSFVSPEVRGRVMRMGQERKAHLSVYLQAFASFTWPHRALAGETDEDFCPKLQKRSPRDEGPRLETQIQYDRPGGPGPWR